MTASSLRHLLPLAAGSLCLCLASCKSSSKPGYSGVVDYTTPNTNLSQDEYPFDEKGNYLVDVVSGKKKGSKNKKTAAATASTPSYTDTYEKPPEAAAPTVAAATTNYETPPTTSSDPYASVYSSEGIGSGSTASSKPKSSSSGSSSTKPKTTASKPKPKPTVAKAKPKPKPKAKPQPSSISYTVKKGDTLYGLASRYGTSVAAIKKASGISSDLLRDGKTLKIPRK